MEHYNSYRKLQIRRRTTELEYGYFEEEVIEDIGPHILLPSQEAKQGNPNAKAKKEKNGMEFYEELPEGAVRCKSYTQFYKLKPNAKIWKEENVIKKVGMYYLIYSPYSKIYWLRQVYDHTDPQKLKEYIRDKNLYLLNP